MSKSAPASTPAPSLTLALTPTLTPTLTLAPALARALLRALSLLLSPLPSLLTTRPALLFAALLAASCAGKPPVVPPTQTTEPLGVTVRAWWGGGNATQTADRVAAPLEAELSRISGVARTVTQCDEKGCTILLVLSPNVNNDDVAFEASTAVKRVQNKLPPGATASAFAADMNRPPDLVLALVLNAAQVTAADYPAALEFANNLMRFPLAVRYNIPGMPEAKIYVEIAPARAKALGIEESEIAPLIQTQVLAIDEHTRVVLGRKPGTADIGNTILKRVGTAVVRLRDVANINVVMTPADVYRVNTEPVILIELYLRSGSPPADVKTCLDRILDPKGPKLPAPFRRILVLKMRTR